MKKGLLINLGIVIVAAAAFYVSWSNRDWGFGKEQPLNFKHKPHTDLNMSCVSCHTGAKDNEHSGIPPVMFCAGCHDPNHDKPKTPPILAEAITNGTELEWEQLHRVPDHVFYSHRRHAGIAKLECQTCHGQVEEMTEPFTKPAFLTHMDTCVKCHEQKGADLDCLVCHK